MGTITLVDQLEDAANATVYSKSCNIGTATSDRIIAVAVSCRGASTPTLSCTIGGNAATSAVNSSITDGNGTTRAQIFELAVPSGTTATITVTASSTLARLGFAVYSLTGVTSGAAVTGTDASSNVDAASLSATVNPAQSGVGIGVIYAARTASHRGSAATSSSIASGSQTITAAISNSDSTVTWTGLTENTDVFLETTGGASSPAFAAAIWYDAASGVTGTGSGTFAVTGSASGAVRIAGSGSGTFTVTGAATGAVRVAGTASGAFNVTGSATGQVGGLTPIAGTAAGTFTVTGSATGTVVTGGAGIIKAGVDDGPATWFYIETAGVTQPEGNSGVTAYNIVVRRGGNLSGTNTVVATASGTGPNPANGADFQGGSFPSQTLSFGPGVATRTFTCNVVGDTTSEIDETFAVTLSSPSSGTVLVASGKDTITCVITNDDAPLVGAFVWLGSTLTGAPAISGSPPGATYLNFDESTFVTRGGVTMRAGGGFASNSGFASAPFAALGNTFQRIDFQLAAGDWEVGVIVQGDATNSGTLKLIDDPLGAATERYSYVMPVGANRLIDTDGTQYTDATNAVASAINNLSYVTVTVSNLGGGLGILRITSPTDTLRVSAVSLREVA